MTPFSGLFNFGIAATVQHLTVAFPVASTIATGAVVAQAPSGGVVVTVTSCAVTGAAVHLAASAGGLVCGGATVAVSACTSSAAASGVASGGIVGNSCGGTIADCTSTGAVSGGIDNVGSSGAGGIAGAAYSGSVTRCYGTGDITGYLTGGIVGSLCSGTITQSCTTGNIASDYFYGGGIAGGSLSGTVTNCYTRGTVQNGGGIAGGVSGTIRACFSSGLLQGWSGIVNELVDGGVVTDCYSCGDMSGGANGISGAYAGPTIGSITNCYSTGDMDTYSVGIGAVGINNCYSVGALLDPNTGGISYVPAGASVTYSYALHSTSLGPADYGVMLPGSATPAGLDTCGFGGASATWLASNVLAVLDPTATTVWCDGNGVSPPPPDGTTPFMLTAFRGAPWFHASYDDTSGFQNQVTGNGYTAVVGVAPPAYGIAATYDGATSNWTLASGDSSNQTTYLFQLMTASFQLDATATLAAGVTAAYTVMASRPILDVLAPVGAQTVGWLPIPSGATTSLTTWTVAGQYLVFALGSTAPGALTLERLPNSSGGVRCFGPNTHIQCADGTYVPIEQLALGTMVRTCEHGPRAVVAIKSCCITTGRQTAPKDALFVLSPDKYPSLWAPLTLTGAHAVLERTISAAQRQDLLALLGRIFVTGSYYRLCVCVDDRAVRYDGQKAAEEHKPCVVWHFALESERDTNNYGVFANGLLVESASIRTLRDLMPTGS